MLRSLRFLALAGALALLFLATAVLAVPPGPPTSVFVVSRTESSALLQWTPGAGTTQAFKIRKSAQAGVHPDPGPYPGGKTAAFTFCTDDGLVDNLVYEPIFTSRGLRYTAFVNPGLTATGNRMTWTETEFLFQQGHEVYSHGDNHVALIDDRAISVRYLGAEACTLRVRVDTLMTIIEGVGTDLYIDLTDPSAQYLVDLAALIDADPDYEATLHYSDNQQYATQSNFIDPLNPGVNIGQGAPAETLTTERGVHDDAELLAEIENAGNALEAHLQVLDPTYECRYLAYPNYAHRQRVMSALNERGYVAARAGTLGELPFFSEASYAPDFLTSYDVPTATPRPNNSWDEATTRAKYQSRLASWKAGNAWAVIMAHSETESDSAHVDWMIDEVASDPQIWVAPFGEVATYLAGFYTDVGYPVDSTGTASAWIHDLSPSEMTWVVVTGYSDAFEESGWSNEVAIPPVTGTAAPAVAPPPAAPVAWPNPFSTRTTIRFDAPRAGPATVEIVDVRGARVWRRDFVVPAGAVRVDWDGCGASGRPLPSGIYLVRARAGGAVQTGRLTLVR